MKLNSGRFLLAMVSSAAMAMTMTACSGGGSGGAAAGGVSSITNIKGQIGGTGGGGFFARGFRAAKHRFVSAQQVNGCTVSAYTLTGTTPVATVQSSTVNGDPGIYVLTGAGLQAGVQYKIVADCTAQGGNVVSAVQGAATTDPTSAPAAPVNDTTTLIATEIVQAIVTAVQSATSGLPPSVATAVENSILTPQALANIVSVVSTTIQTAIDNGTMQPPSDASSSAMSGAVQSTTTTTTLVGGNIPAIGDYVSTDSTNTTLPPAVTTVVSGVSSQAAALPGCDPTLASTMDIYNQPLSSLNKCIIAVAKLMNSVVNFDVAIRMDASSAFNDYYYGAAYNVNTNANPTHGIGSCAGSDPVLSVAFPNATFTLSNSNQAEFNDGGAFCIVHNSLPSVDRNSSPSNYGNNNHNGLLSGETGPNGSFFANGGVLTALGTALWNAGATNTRAFHLSDIDNIVFTPAASVGANKGMDARLLYVSPQYTWSAPPQNGNYSPLSSSLSLLGVSGGATTLVTWPTCTGSPCADPSQGDGSAFSFTSTDWSSATALTAFANAIGNSSWVGSVFYQKFGGPIPAEATLTNQLVNGTTHVDGNRTGQALFYVLYTAQPSWNDPACNFNSGNSITPTGNLTIAGTWTSGQNIITLGNGTDLTTLSAGQLMAAGNGIPANTYITSVNNFNNTINISNQLTQSEANATNFLVAQNPVCIANNGSTWSVQPAVTVNLSYGAVDNNGYHHISQILVPNSGTGQYYIMPAMNGGPFNGLVQFVDSTTGAVLLDDNLNPRWVQIVFDTANQCNQAGIPASGPNCAAMDMFNVSVSWNCNNNGPCVPNVSQFSTGETAPINSGSPTGAYSFTLSFQPNQTQGQGGPGVVGAAFESTGQNAGSNNFTPFMVTVNPATAEITAVALQGQNVSLGANQYNIQQYFNCSTPGQPCQPEGFILVAGGTPYQGDDNNGGYGGTAQSGDVTTGSACGTGPNSCLQNVLVYKEAYFVTDISSVTWPWADNDSTTGTFRRVAESPAVDMGPAANPNYDCTLDPFFLDVNGNGKIDYTTDQNGHNTCTEPTFGNDWSAGQFLNYNPQNNPNPNPFSGNGFVDANFPNITLNVTQAKALMLPNPSNGYLYGDPKAASALLHVAFGPMLDGQHTLDNTVNLNALQVFSLIYMYFTGSSNNASNINGIYTANGSSNLFETATPACNGSDGTCNAAIFGGIGAFYQGAPTSP